LEGIKGAMSGRSLSSDRDTADAFGPNVHCPLLGEHEHLEAVLRLSCLSERANRIFRDLVGEIDPMGLIRRTDITSFWKDRLAPWLLGDFANNESVTHNDASAISQIKAAIHSCLGSMDKAMRQNWHRKLAGRFRNNRTL